MIREVFITEDGSYFNTREEAEEYERVENVKGKTLKDMLALMNFRNDIGRDEYETYISAFIRVIENREKIIKILEKYYGE